MFLTRLPVVLRLVPALRIQLALHIENVRVVIRNFGPVFVSRGWGATQRLHRHLSPATCPPAAPRLWPPRRPFTSCP